MQYLEFETEEDALSCADVINSWNGFKKPTIGAYHIDDTRILVPDGGVYLPELLIKDLKEEKA